MQSGLTVVGVKNLGFLIDDTRTEVKDGELDVNTSWLGMFPERHWRNSPEAAKDGTDP
jgi:F420-0:gamma-glutamyl ligase